MNWLFRWFSRWRRKPTPVIVEASAMPTSSASFGGATTSTSPRTFRGIRPYGPKAPWNIPVANVPVHPQSATYAGYLWADFAGLIPELNYRKYTYAVYDATQATDQYRVIDLNGWGNLGGKYVPWNSSWAQNAGTDAQAIILDAVPGTEWNLWKITADHTAKTLTIGNGNKCPGDYLTNNWDNPTTKCTGSRGCGIQYLAMLVRPWEIDAGVIEHALSMPIKGTSGAFYVAPATKLEHPGKTGKIPEGMRFALNVTHTEIQNYVDAQSISVSAKRVLRIVLTALKDYGWFITDTAGSSHLQFEAPESAGADWIRLDAAATRFLLRGFMTQARIVTFVPSDQYPV